MSQGNQDNGIDQEQLAAAGAMILDLAKLVRAHRDNPDRNRQRDQPLVEAVERYRSLHKELLRAMFAGGDPDSYTDLQQHTARVRHRALELSGTIGEYVSMPVSSLEYRMYMTVERYVSDIEQLEQEAARAKALKGAEA